MNATAPTRKSPSSHSDLGAPRLGLSPSPSGERARRFAPALEALLQERVPGLRVEVASGYKSLGDDLLSGALTLAWAPPIVCARVEIAGGSVALRAVRGDASTYRAGLVCRVGETRTLADAHELEAAWVDEDSAAGFLLARSWLAVRHIDAIHGFKRVRFCGTYGAALSAVASGEADVTSVFVSAEQTAPRTTLDDLAPATREKLRIFAFTGETPSDGIVVPPGPPSPQTAAIVDALRALESTDAGRTVMTQLFACDALAPCPPRPPSTGLRDLMKLSMQDRAGR